MKETTSNLDNMWKPLDTWFKKKIDTNKKRTSGVSSILYVEYVMGFCVGYPSSITPGEFKFWVDAIDNRIENSKTQYISADYKVIENCTYFPAAFNEAALTAFQTSNSEALKKIPEGRWVELASQRTPAMRAEFERAISSSGHLSKKIPALINNDVKKRLASKLYIVSSKASLVKKKSDYFGFALDENKFYYIDRDGMLNDFPLAEDQENAAAIIQELIGMLKNPFDEKEVLKKQLNTTTSSKEIFSRLLDMIMSHQHASITHIFEHIENEALNVFIWMKQVEDDPNRVVVFLHRENALTESLEYVANHPVQFGLPDKPVYLKKLPTYVAPEVEHTDNHVLTSTLVEATLPTCVSPNEAHIDNNVLASTSVEEIIPIWKSYAIEIIKDAFRQNFDIAKITGMIGNLISCFIQEVVQGEGKNAIAGELINQMVEVFFKQRNKQQRHEMKIQDEIRFAMQILRAIIKKLPAEKSEQESVERTHLILESFIRINFIDKLKNSKMQVSEKAELITLVITEFIRSRTDLLDINEESLKRLAGILIFRVTKHCDNPRIMDFEILKHFLTQVKFLHVPPGPVELAEDEILNFLNNSAFTGGGVSRSPAEANIENKRLALERNPTRFKRVSNGEASMMNLPHHKQANHQDAHAVNATAQFTGAEPMAIPGNSHRFFSSPKRNNSWTSFSSSPPKQTTEPKSKTSRLIGHSSVQASTSDAEHNELRHVPAARI